MEVYEIEAQVRSKRGKGVARKLRAQGDIPAVCYRRGIESIPLSVSGAGIQKVLKAARGRNILVRLKIHDEDRQEQKTVMLKELQRGPLSRLLHVDFLEVLMDEKIVVEVPIRLVGEATEVVRAGASIQQVRREIEIECLPGKIPDDVDVDISSIKIGDSFQVENIRVDPDIRILTDLKEPIFTIISAAEEIEEKVAEEAEEAVSEQEES
jgi:large subunit ribosomal protein L25